MCFACLDVHIDAIGTPESEFRTLTKEKGCYPLLPIGLLAVST